jgi:hypothetical protein
VKRFPLFKPYTFLGEDAASVISPEEHEQAFLMPTFSSIISDFSPDK